MYSYQLILKEGGYKSSPIMNTIGELKRRFRRLEGITNPRLYDKEKSLYTEIVVLKHSAPKNLGNNTYDLTPKIHGYYDVTFVKDASKPAMIHNVLYGLGV